MTETTLNSDTTTPALPLFYKNVVPLNKEAHSALHVEEIKDYLHTRQTNSIYIAAVEFLPAAREYPIVFAKGADGRFFPALLLGLEENKNLFVDAEGKWLAEYIPAYVRRYPFILATPEDSGQDKGEDTTFTVCIDEDFPGFNRAWAGKPLFDEQGRQTELLDQAMDFLRDYQSQVQLTAGFCQNLAGHGLFEPMQANIELASGAKHVLGGFFGVSRDKLKALKPEQLGELLKSDEMELIFAHLSSLSNLDKLMKRLGGTDTDTRSLA